MTDFVVTITRSAYENVDLHVEASSQEAAEEKVCQLLNRLDITLDEIKKHEGIEVATMELVPDEESAWELL